MPPSKQLTVLKFWVVQSFAREPSREAEAGHVIVIETVDGIVMVDGIGIVGIVTVMMIGTAADDAAVSATAVGMGIVEIGVAVAVGIEGGDSATRTFYNCTTTTTTTRTH